MLVLAVVVCVLIISTIWSVKVLHTIWWRPKMIEKQLKKQGIHTENVFVVWYGTTPRVAIMDPKLIKEILLNKSGEFPKTEINSFTKLFATGLASYDGDKWAKHRKIINPAFHFEKLKQMLPAFSTCTEELIVKWEKLVSSDGGCELDVSLEFLNLTGDVISREAAFGSNFEEGRLIFLLQKEQGKLFLRTQLLNMSLPFLRCIQFLSLSLSLSLSVHSRNICRQFLMFMPTKINKRMRQIYGEVGALLRGITEKREESIQMGSDEKDDLLNLFNQNSNAGMTAEDVIEECKLFYFADQETTANLLTWSMIAMSMHQNWQERAREEVLQIDGKNNPTFDDLNHLKILNMILLEVLRLYPPSSLLRPGVPLFIPLHIVHRDPEQWGEDALEFNPERFA
ncbi:hypothetical protein ACOSQ4_004124 [Xanthoceras sorbifolium]